MDLIPSAFVIVGLGLRASPMPNLAIPGVALSF